MPSSPFTITRRQFGIAAASVALAPAQQASKPNVLIIVADDLGYGDLACFGASDLRTPNLDALAKSGMKFTNFYANSPVCSPTRAALLTGIYPDRAGVPGVIRTHPENSWGYLSPSTTLLPVALKSAGYHTAAVGKWHLGLEPPNTPNLRGFDHFHGFLGDMMDDYFTHRRHDRNYMRLDGNEIDPKGHATDLFSQWAVDYLNSRRNSRSPFLLYLAYNAPHVPLQPAADWLEKAKARGLAGKRAQLAGLIDHMDSGIGRVVDSLKGNGQYENTLILFVSDNGGQVDAGATNGPLRGSKQEMYEGGIRVPMIASWPGRIAAGKRSARVGMAMDLYATACEAAAVSPPSGIDSVSLLPHLTGPEQAAPQRDLVWVRREGGMAYQGRDYYVFRRGDWKLMQNTPFEPYQLFNLQRDPAETTDLSKAEPKIYRELATALMLHVQKAGATPWQK